MRGDRIRVGVNGFGVIGKRIADAVNLQRTSTSSDDPAGPPALSLAPCGQRRPRSLTRRRSTRRSVRSPLGAVCYTVWS